MKIPSVLMYILNGKLDPYLSELNVHQNLLWEVSKDHNFIVLLYFDSFTAGVYVGYLCKELSVFP